MTKRSVFHSVPSNTGWRVIEGGRMISTHHTQKQSEAAAIAAGHEAQDAGGLGQAVLHKSDGTVREERIYGADPRKTKG
ncbi:DUF2188 domain-containing protein [Pseudaminobacter soli (ex Li et al. 2025)]|uniref:DUF2188 domain-containing protein n=1 Tax=Pseudaminobacter soli (ex Li et al. 2025) TaxID=1295366 RepID=A0A2P7S1D6_9HYPH|nr:DUF2188 domain-containing protein [Mesorhizobium soli]PSJ56295.1 hypothetical protein C7I85_25250 [Mesorhizobium soli]